MINPAQAMQDFFAQLTLAVIAFYAIRAGLNMYFDAGGDGEK